MENQNNSGDQIDTTPMTMADLERLIQMYRAEEARAKTRHKNKYNLTAEQVEAMEEMTAKEKKQYLKGLVCI